MKIFTLKLQCTLLLFCSLSIKAQQISITIDTRDPKTDEKIAGDEPLFSNLKQILLDKYTDKEISEIIDLKIDTKGTYKFIDSRGNERELPISIEPNDFLILNAMPKLANLDISDATITGRSNNNVDNSFPRGAFDGNNSLKKINLPKNAVGLARNAFSNTVLEGTFTLPKGIKNVAEYDMIFGGSVGITQFEVESGNLQLKTIDGVLYTIDEKTLLIYPYGKTGESFVIPEGVTTIGTSAFGWNESLEEITIAKTIVSLPRQDKIINNSTKIKAFHVVDGNIKYGSTNGFLVDKETSTLMAFPPGNTDETIIIDGSIVKHIPNGYFSYAVANLKNIIFTEGVETIGYTCFKIGNNITSVLEYVELPSTLKRIDGEAFVGNANLLQVICKATTPPQLNGQQIFRGSNDIAVRLGVPAESVSAYQNSQWNRSISANAGINCFTPDQIVAYGNISVTNGTCLQSASAPNFSVKVFANEAPEGKAFVGWIAQPSADFVNPKSPIGIFTMPKGDVEIQATFSSKKPYTMIDAITPSGEAPVGGIVNIEADPLKDEKTFHYWKVIEGKNLIIDNPYAISTTFTMVDGAVTIAAQYATAYSINIIGGSAPLEAFENEIVTITATPKKDREFVNWTTTTPKLAFGDPNSATTTFVMPAKEVDIQANFRDVISIEENQQVNFILYPNPAADYIQIKDAMNLNYIIYDMAGNVIVKGVTNGESIPTNSFSPGIYLFKTDETTIRFVKK